MIKKLWDYSLVILAVVFFLIDTIRLKLMQNDLMDMLKRSTDAYDDISIQFMKIDAYVQYSGMSYLGLICIFIAFILCFLIRNKR